MSPRPRAGERPRSNRLLQEAIYTSDGRESGRVRDAPEGRFFFIVRWFSVTASEEVVDGDDGVSDDEYSEDTGESVLVVGREFYRFTTH